MTTTTTKQDLAAELKAAGFSYYPKGDDAVQAAARAGLPLEDALEAAKASSFSAASIRESYAAVADGGAARDIHARLEADDERQRQARQARQARKGTRFAPARRERVTEDHAALYGAGYLGHEGEWTNA